MKYKRLENDEGTLRGKLNKINIHSLRKKGDRFAGYLKILTGVEPQVTTCSSFTLCRRRNRSVIGLNSRHTRAFTYLWLCLQVRDEVFDKEEKLFRSLEKAVRQLAKNVNCYVQYTQVRTELL